MDPLSITAGVVASLQVACSVLGYCYGVRSQMQKMPWTLIQIIEEVRNLRNLIEALESILCGGEFSDNPGNHSAQKSETLPRGIEPIISDCLAELRRLETRIRPEMVDLVLGSKRKALTQALSWRLKGDDAKESIRSLQRCKDALNLALNSHNSLILRKVERLSLSLDHKMDLSQQQIGVLTADIGTAQLDKNNKAVVEWLSPLRPGRNHLMAQARHQSGTSEWFQQSAQFQEWLNEPNAILWLSGPPGSGKTVMMSHAIESISRQTSVPDVNAICAFVYCDFQDPDTQHTLNILGSILSQMCTQTNYFPQELLSAYKASTERGYGSSPPLEIVIQAIEVVSRKKQTFVFIDGLDEAEDGRGLAKELVMLTSISTLNVLATSRNEVAIQRIFDGTRRVCLEHHVEEMDKDIEQYILERLRTDEGLTWLSPEIQSLVSASLVSKSKGTFRWAACQLDSLSRCRTTREIKMSLEKIPQGLNETYGRLLGRSAPSDVGLVRKILTWLSFSYVPITLNQLWEALCIDSERRCVDEELRLRSPQDILLASHSLVSVSSDGHVMLAHLSVRDYLLSDEIKKDAKSAIFSLKPETCHLELARDCLAYLFASDLSSGPSTTQEKYLSRLRQFPLLRYATKYWFYHARSSGLNDGLQNLTLEFFSPGARQNFMSWVQVLNADSPFKWSVYPEHATPVYYASSLGLDQAVESLIQSMTVDQLNAPGSRFGGTALHAATIRGHLTIIERLLAAGADASKADFDQVTPLHTAASQGFLDIIKTLLDHGASRDAPDGLDSRTPADWARLGGQMAAADLIEKHSRDSSHDKNPQGRLFKDRVDESKQATEPAQVELWQPGASYFPDYYERRSGIDSSRIVRIVVGERTSCFDTTFIPLMTEGEMAQLNAVW